MLSKMKEWGYHEKAIQENQDLSDEDKEKVLRGLHSIKRILGKDFLPTVVQDRHPILGYFRNTAPWTRLWLKEFGEMLSILEESKRFEDVKQELMSSKNFSWAISELELAYRFKMAGFSVEFYRNYRRHQCDLVVQKTGEEVYVEVSTIGPSDEERKASYTFNELTKSFIFDPEIQIAGKIHKALSHPNIAEIKREISSCIRKAKVEQKCFEVNRFGIIDMIICPRSLSAQAHEWLKKAGKGSHIEGPSHDVDEIQRIRRKFRKENKQLPKNKPGLVVLFHDNIIVRGDAESYRELASEIDEEIYDHQNLIAGVLIFPHFVGSQEAYGSDSNFAWSRRTRHRLGGENTLVIKNRFSEFKVDDEMTFTLLSGRDLNS